MSSLPSQPDRGISSTELSGESPKMIDWSKARPGTVKLPQYDVDFQCVRVSLTGILGAERPVVKEYTGVLILREQADVRLLRNRRSLFQVAYLDKDGTDVLLDMDPEITEITGQAPSTHSTIAVPDTSRDKYIRILRIPSLNDAQRTAEVERIVGNNEEYLAVLEQMEQGNKEKQKSNAALLEKIEKGELKGYALLQALVDIHGTKEPVIEKPEGIPEHQRSIEQSVREMLSSQNKQVPVLDALLALHEDPLGFLGIPSEATPEQVEVRIQRVRQLLQVASNRSSSPEFLQGLADLQTQLDPVLTDYEKYKNGPAESPAESPAEPPKEPPKPGKGTGGIIRSLLSALSAIKT